MCGKKMSKYIYNVKKKKNLFGMLYNKRKQGNDHETSLKEEEQKLKLQCFHYAMHALFQFLYFTYR